MYLYLIFQDRNNNYDTYDSAVVAAESLHDAQMTHPGGSDYIDDDYSWCNPEYVGVEYLGVAKEGAQAGVICSSFNAG